MARPSPQVRRAGRSPLLAELLLTLSDQDDHPTHDLATAAGNSALKATPEDVRSNPVFQRAEQLLASIRKEIREQGGPTNPELLQEKDPAAVWHLLDGLKRFDSLDPRRVGEITFEVARLGEKLSPRHKDTEKSSSPPRCRCPLRLVFRFASFAPAHVALRAAFSRLPSQRPLACVQQFPSCLMYAGFERIASEQNTGMDLNEPWITALELFSRK